MTELRKISVEDWCRLAEEGIAIPITTYLSGISMEPMIRYQKDPVTIKPVDRDLIPGDVVLFRRPDGAFVVHRVFRVLNNGREVQTWGDNCKDSDPVMPAGAVLGIAVAYERDGKRYVLDTDEQRKKGLMWLQSKYRRAVWFLFRRVRVRMEGIIRDHHKTD